MFKEVIRNAGLAGFAEIGLILFLIGFGLMLLRVRFGMSEEEVQQMSHLPLEAEEQP